MLVDVCPDNGRPLPPEKVAEGRASFEICPDGDRALEGPCYLEDLDAAAAGEGGADDDVVLARVPVQ